MPEYFSYVQLIQVYAQRWPINRAIRKSLILSITSLESADWDLEKNLLFI